MDVFHLSVALFDLFLSSIKSPPISRAKLQCVGATCVRIAFDTVYNSKTDEGLEIVAMTSKVDPESSPHELRRMYMLVLNHFNGKQFLLLLMFYFRITKLFSDWSPIIICIV